MCDRRYTILRYSARNSLPKFIAEIRKVSREIEIPNLLVAKLLNTSYHKENVNGFVKFNFSRKTNGLNG